MMLRDAIINMRPAPQGATGGAGQDEVIVSPLT
jgi:hypothetical protein